MNVPFFVTRRISESLLKEHEEAHSRVLKSDLAILGPELEAFEKELGIWLDPKSPPFIVGCNSGTDALILAMLLLDIKAGDEVITVSHTAIPTITAIHSTGAKPVFCDIEPGNWMMDIKKV